MAKRLSAMPPRMGTRAIQAARARRTDWLRLITATGRSRRQRRSRFQGSGLPRPPASMTLSAMNSGLASLNTAAPMAWPTATHLRVTPSSAAAAFHWAWRLPRNGREKITSPSCRGKRTQTSGLAVPSLRASRNSSAPLIPKIRPPKALTQDSGDGGQGPMGAKGAQL